MTAGHKPSILRFVFLKGAKTMLLQTSVHENVRELVERLNSAEKVDRALRLMEEAHQEYRERLVVANSLGKDSCVV